MLDICLPPPNPGVSVACPLLENAKFEFIVLSCILLVILPLLSLLLFLFVMFVLFSFTDCYNTMFL